MAFSSLGQSAAFNTFSQTGQTYGLPPFGLSQSGALLHTTFPCVLSLHLKHQSLHTQLPFRIHISTHVCFISFSVSAFSFLCTCVLFSLHVFPRTRVAIGAMWPGIKSEPRLQDVSAAGQTPFLSFSTAYTSTQPCQTLYSYPSQGKAAPFLPPSLTASLTLVLPLHFLQMLSFSCTVLYCILQKKGLELNQYHVFRLWERHSSIREGIHPKRIPLHT